MGSKRSTLSKVLIIAMSLPFFSGTCFTAAFTVELGTFKTLSAVTAVLTRSPST